MNQRGENDKPNYLVIGIIVLICIAIVGLALYYFYIQLQPHVSMGI